MLNTRLAALFTTLGAKTMNRISPQMAVVALFAALVSGIGLSPSAAHAQTGDWEYVEALGGYLDWDTGLVWGEHARNVLGFGPGWDFVQNNYLPSYRTLTGISQWRMPTVSESQLAAAHGINSLINPPRGIYCWTSESKSKGWAKTTHYAVEPFSGLSYLYNNKSNINFIPVYRVFTP